MHLLNDASPNSLCRRKAPQGLPFFDGVDTVRGSFGDDKGRPVRALVDVAVDL